MGYERPRAWFAEARSVLAVNGRHLFRLPDLTPYPDAAMRMIKALVKDFFVWVIRGFSRTNVGLYAYQQILDTAMDRKKAVTYHSNKMTFSAPNRLCDYRVKTFENKEPDTLDWIESIAEGAVLWDVGANVGLYTVYAAKARKCEVYAFEPSVFNLELLTRNIFLNHLQRQVTVLPIALSDALGEATFRMSTTVWGGALSTFGEEFDQHGLPLKTTFEYKTFGLSMDEAASLLQIPLPRHIKIDVDGLEHFILRGGSDVLKQVESVLIEINDDFSSQSEESARCLKEAGLSLYRKCDIDAAMMFNQWWVRDSA